MKAIVTLVCVMFFAQVVHAAEAPTCPEQLDTAKRRTLKLSEDFEEFRRDTDVKVTRLTEQKNLLLDNEKLAQESGGAGWKAASYYKEAWQDAEKRATRAWFESPGFLISVGVFISLAAIAGAIGVGKAFEARLIQQGQAQ